MLMEPLVVSVKLYRSIESEWFVENYHRLEQTIPLPEIGGELSVRDAYYGLQPEIGPDLSLVSAPVPKRPAPTR